MRVPLAKLARPSFDYERLRLKLGPLLGIGSLEEAPAEAEARSSVVAASKNVSLANPTGRFHFNHAALRPAASLSLFGALEIELGRCKWHGSREGELFKCHAGFAN